MIKHIHFLLCIFLFIGYSNNLEAQYLKVKSKNAKIRDIAGINGNVLEKVNKGTIFHVTIPLKNHKK